MTAERIAGDIRAHAVRVYDDAPNISGITTTNELLDR